MLLIKGGQLKAPDDARTLVTGLWQLGIGRTLGFYILSARGEEPVLGVASRDVVMEERAAEMVAAMVAGSIEDGNHIPHMILSRQGGFAAARLFPKADLIHDETWRVWISNRVDPLKMAYRQIAACGTGGIAGVGMVVRPLWSEKFQMRMTAFAAGDEADATAALVVGSYKRVGTLARRVLSARRAIEECLEARMSWPWAKVHSDQAALFWHAPYEAGVLVRTR